MTLLGFQQALCDMVASPDLCLQVRSDPDTALEPYALEPLEMVRLASVARQRGMSTNCTLYRVNRVTPIYSYVILTCTLLDKAFIPELERFWRRGKPKDLQFGPEAERFTSYLAERINEGALTDPRLPSVLEYELAAHALLRGKAPLVRRIPFCEDPEPLMAALRKGQCPPADSSGCELFELILDGRGQGVKLSVAQRSSRA